VYINQVALTINHSFFRSAIGVTLSESHYVSRNLAISAPSKQKLSIMRFSSGHSTSDVSRHSSENELMQWTSQFTTSTLSEIRSFKASGRRVKLGNGTNSLSGLGNGIARLSSHAGSCAWFCGQSYEHAKDGTSLAIDGLA
jgi:hypothetical protein